MRTCEDGCNGCDDCTDYAGEDPHPDYPCRHDGRCQYAIDSGAEGLGHCPRGKCVMPDGGPALPDSKTHNTELVDKTSETPRSWVDKMNETPIRRNAIENDTETLLRLCADDPMWAEHAEVSKSLLVRAADELAALRKTAEQLQKLAGSKTPKDQDQPTP